MSFRTILVHVDNSNAARTRIDAAVQLASRFKCSLTGVYPRSELFPKFVLADALAPVPVGALEQTIEERTQEIGKASAAARRIFDDAARDSGVAFYWLDINGDSPAALIDCARRHDLTIVPPIMKPVFGEATITAAQIGMAAGGPALVLKHGGYPTDFGKRILVAWNDSRESARALRDALPFLCAAEEVNFLTVSQSAEPNLDELMLRHLRSHGCKFGRVVVDRSDAVSVGDLIKLHVGETGADMVVLGLYGHSRLQEMVLGGVSRDLLHDPPMPMLISH